MASDTFLSWANRTLLRPGREDPYLSIQDIVVFVRDLRLALPSGGATSAIKMPWARVELCARFHSVALCGSRGDRPIFIRPQGQSPIRPFGQYPMTFGQ